ncbi:pyruvate kinase-like [Parasteatoda tepidariorum]|uniref:pyruvate kinase-like n=1 Tax=Parasteatoda tepidariorum TaxID=114398 RepID=UPI001C71E1C8|nr:pyruvate kinase-like [Parasteatoda tepidariorum]
MDSIFFDDQITIPEEFPSILKNYAKAAIKTNPPDLLAWSRKYFTALSKGERPPARERLKFDKSQYPFLTVVSKEAKMAEKSLEQRLIENMSLNAIDHACAYTVYEKTHHPRLSKIVCTIGPATQSVEKLVELMEAGMNVARLNFSHGEYDYHGQTAANVREAAKIVAKNKGLDSYPVAIALDTKGPEIRTGLVEGDKFGEIELKKGSTVKLTTDDSYFDKCNSETVYIDYKNITKVIKEGNKIYMDDGQITLIVKKVGGDWVECEVGNESKLGSEKGCNLPGIDTDLPAVSEKDKEDFAFGLELEVDYIFASFIRNADGVKQIRKLLGDKGKHIWIIPKIENDEGIQNFDEILEVSEAIMVARGDLGINIPTEKIFLAQKMMISKCNVAGKPVLCATQMLDSMVQKPRPTRAEACDVANAILDGADGVMLSAESAKGQYAVECVTVQHKITHEAETVLNQRVIFSDLLFREVIPSHFDTCMAIAAVAASLKCLASAIIVLTKAGRAAYAIAKFRPRCPIIMVTRSGTAFRQSQMWRAIYAFHYTEEMLPDYNEDVDARVQYGIKNGMQLNILKKDDPVIIVSESTDTMRIINIE